MSHRYHSEGLLAYDIERTIDRVTEIFQNDTETHGFVKRIEIEKRAKDNSIKVIRNGGEIVAAIDFNHGQRKPETTIYNLAVEQRYRGQGYRKRLLDRVVSESPHDWITTKVPVDVSQNYFWQKHATLRWVEDGRKRKLNVYRIYNGEKHQSVFEL